MQHLSNFILIFFLPALLTTNESDGCLAVFQINENSICIYKIQKVLFNL